MLKILAQSVERMSNPARVGVVIVVVLVAVGIVALLIRSAARGGGGTAKAGTDTGPGRFDVEGTDFTSKGKEHASLQAASPAAAAAQAGREGMVVEHVTREQEPNKTHGS